MFIFLVIEFGFIFLLDRHDLLLQGWKIGSVLSLNIMANWLQCREVLHDGSRKWFRGTICGKWRRAPLFEIQTDDWDCSCSVRWDPTHSDCAVPQELGTDQVLAHLKSLELVYIPSLMFLLSLNWIVLWWWYIMNCLANS
ncbi:unnamed protein product, partial [Vitis vinifera]